MQSAVDAKAPAAKRVLVVEDDDGVREAIAVLLTDALYEPLLATNGYDALELLERENVPPGLIVLDLMMPAMNGQAFASVLRDQPRWRDVPILVVSADRAVEEVSKVIGAAGMLQKPFDVDRFNELVGQLFRAPSSEDRARLYRRIDTPPALRKLLPKKALLIDDSEVSLKDTARALTAAGIDVVATLGLVGVGAALSREAPDIVVIGSSMPLVFHKRLVALLRERGAVCVLLSGDVGEDNLARAVSDAGADGYVPIRAEPAKVVAAVENAYARKDAAMKP